MALFLDILAALFFLVTGPYWIYALLTSRKYRIGWPERFGFVPRRADRDRPCLWVHGVSVGEILTARALVDRFAATHPHWEIVFSTITPDGNRIARRTYPDRMVFYFPMDFSFIVRRTLRRIRPTAVVLIEQDLWANFLYHTNRQRIPVLLANGRLSRKSYRLYRIVRWPLFRPFKKIRRYCVQTQEYADRFAALGIPRKQIFVTGSMKFDNIPTGAADPAERDAVREHLGIGPDEWVLVAGSTHEGEEAALLDAFTEVRRRRPDSRLVLVPRHLERIGQVEALLRERGETYTKKTDLDAGAPKGGAGTVVLVDTMGELMRIYPAASVVFVGGSLVPVGGHNMLEPAGLGLAAVIGPHVFKCRRDVDLLVHAGAGIRASGPTNLREILLDLLEQPDKVLDLGSRALGTLTARQGATDEILRHLEEVLGERREASSPPRPPTERLSSAAAG